MKLWCWVIALSSLMLGAAFAESYILKSGDSLRIEVMEDSSLNRNALVLPDGTIAFPMVGQVKAAGRTCLLYTSPSPRDRG